jgi:NAD+ kinase
VKPARTATVFTHRRPSETADALATLCRAAGEAGVELRFSPEETAKHGLKGTGACLVDAPFAPDVDLCLVLGGDGTILHGLRHYVGTGVPVFGVNFGEVGFLATVDPENTEEGIDRALRGDFEVLSLPSIELKGAGEKPMPAINDVSFQRKHGLRVADLAYAVGDDEVGRVRCDGLVVATPAGSTGYNLANGGPVMAWGVEGFVVSFIAPHSLTARALVIAPGDTITVSNRSREEPADITVDGRPTGQLEPGESFEVSFSEARATLAQIPGASFYHRLREKFGRLATGV